MFGVDLVKFLIVQQKKNTIVLGNKGPVEKSKVNLWIRNPFRLLGDTAIGITVELIKGVERVLNHNRNDNFEFKAISLQSRESES